MKLNTNMLKKLEKRVERVEEDPQKIIQIIKRILEMGCTDIDGSYKINPPVPEEQKVTFYEFVKYFGNYQIERAEENGWDVEKTKRDTPFTQIEERIRAIGGFSDESLPEGTIIKYR